MAFVKSFLIYGLVLSIITVQGKRRSRDGNNFARSSHEHTRPFRPKSNLAEASKSVNSEYNGDDFKERKKQQKGNKAGKIRHQDKEISLNNEEDYGESYSESIGLLYEKPTQGTKQSLKPTTVMDTTLPSTTTKSTNTTGTPSTKPTEESMSTPLPQKAEFSGPGNENEASGDYVALNKNLRSVTPTTNPTEEMMTSNKPTNLVDSTESMRKIRHKHKKSHANSNKNRDQEEKEQIREEEEIKEKVHKHARKVIKGNDTHDEADEDKNEEGETENENDVENIEDNENQNQNSTVKKANEEDTEKRVVCVGDSITEGYYQRGTAFHPYSKKLYELLNAENNTITYNVYNEGISGECVYLEMQKRMPVILDKYKPVDLVIILGGTNDLNSINCSTGNLFDNIKGLHEIAHKANATTVAMTIPDAEIALMPVRREREQWWRKINEQIREYAKDKDNVILCDLAEELPYRTMTDDERAKYWDDHLHYTPQGYDRMAEIIYDAIQGMF